MNTIDELCEQLDRDAVVAVLTGAGMSAESGIPTFRGKDGLWKQYRVEELATPEAFARNPALVLEWYAFRRQIIFEHRPNPGHEALAALSGLVQQLVVITQCVDGYHQSAGQKEVIELHGNILEDRCHDCHKVASSRQTAWRGELLRCSHCDGLLRPNVVWFGERLPANALARGVTLAENCSVFLTIGTSALVYPAASLPEIALAAGAVVAEINIDRTALTPHVHLFIQGAAGNVLPEVVKKLKNR